MALCLSLFAVESQAQAIRFESMVHFADSNTAYAEWGAGFNYERFITRNFSISTGAMFRLQEDPLGAYCLANLHQSYDHIEGEYDWYTRDGNDSEFARVSIPLTAEYKLLLSNRVRLYVNAGLMFNINGVDDLINDRDPKLRGYYEMWEYSDNGKYINLEHHSLTCDANKFNLGFTTGAGFEIGIFRIGVNYDSDITALGEYGGETFRASVFSILGGVRFGGNKRFRTKSKAKTASVPYSILDPQTTTATTTTASQKTTTAPAKKATVAPKAKVETKAEVVAAPVVVKEEPTVVEPVAKESESKQKSEQSTGALRYVRVGMNFAKISNEYASSDYNNMRKLGYYFSCGFHKPITVMGINNLYWGTEFALGTRGYKEKYSDSEYSDKYSMLAHNVQAAQNIGYKYKLPISKINLTVDAHLGIYASYDCAGKFVDEYDDGEKKYEETISEFNMRYKDEYGERAYNRGDIGIAYGFGVWYNNKYNFEFAFQNGLVNPYHDTDYKHRSRNFMLRLGYAF